jgi:hypothetical protein
MGKLLVPSGFYRGGNYGFFKPNHQLVILRPDPDHHDNFFALRWVL